MGRWHAGICWLAGGRPVGAGSGRWLAGFPIPYPAHARGSQHPVTDRPRTQFHDLARAWHCFQVGRTQTSGLCVRYRTARGVHGICESPIVSRSFKAVGNRPARPSWSVCPYSAPGQLMQPPASGPGSRHLLPRRRPPRWRGKVVSKAAGRPTSRCGQGLARTAPRCDEGGPLTGLGVAGPHSERLPGCGPDSMIPGIPVRRARRRLRVTPELSGVLVRFLPGAREIVVAVPGTSCGLAIRMGFLDVREPAYSAAPGHVTCTWPRRGAGLRA